MTSQTANNTQHKSVSVTAVLPTYNRPEALCEAIVALRRCAPAPDEILILIDHDDTSTFSVLREHHPDVRVLLPEKRMGPGGARNLLIAEASHDVVASFDDDSYPMDSDFFLSAFKILEARPDVGVIAATIIHDDEPVPARGDCVRPSAHFIGCGCVYRRAAFLSTKGFVELQPAYGMEEADLALQLADNRWELVEAQSLRVRHATTREHQASAEITRAHISNTALLAYLRYPASYWGLGALQVLSRVLWSLKARRFAGIASGLFLIPAHLWRHRSSRAPVRPDTIRALRRLRSAKRA